VRRQLPWLVLISFRRRCHDRCRSRSNIWLQRCTQGIGQRRRLNRIRCWVRTVVELWNRARRRFDSIQKAALNIVPWLRQILCILWAGFGCSLTKIIPKSVFFAHVDLRYSLFDLWCGVKFCPLLHRVGIMERISNLWNTICTISHVEGRVILLQMLG
jgi:hypothetical protein